MKRIFHLLLTMALLCMTVATNAQIRVGGNTAPNSSAMLDLNPDDGDNAVRGLALPRVKLVSTTNSAPLAAHVAGMLVYNMVTANDVNPGVYYNDGTKWIRREGLQSNVKQLEIPINEIISTRSMIYHGESNPVSSNLKVLNVEPVFSNEVMALTLFGVNSLAKPNEAGTAIKWSVKIANSNIDASKSSKLQKIIISYICDEELTTSSLTETYILVGQ